MCNSVSVCEPAWSPAHRPRCSSLLVTNTHRFSQTEILQHHWEDSSRFIIVDHFLLRLELHNSCTFTCFGFLTLSGRKQLQICVIPPAYNVVKILNVQRLTGAVLGTDGVSIKPWSTEVAVVSCSVVHAAQTLSRLRVTVDEQHVGVAVAVTVAWLTAASENHRVAIESRGTPVKRPRGKYAEWR